MIYFDNGATTYPKPRRVTQAVQEAFVRQGANPGRSGHKLALDTALGVYSCREAAAEFFHIESPEHVVFCQNATHAINLAIKGCLQSGDHVIISDLEHNSVLRPVHTMAQYHGVTYSIAEVDPEDDAATIANFARLIRPETRLIACTHGSNVFGIRLPIKQIGRLAAQRDILFLVDAAQTAGVVDINIPECNIDFLCTAGHKSLYGPSGTGLLITRHGESLGTIMEGGTGSFSAEYSQPAAMPDRLESGTANTCGIMGLKAGIGFVREKGIENLYSHEFRVAKELYSKLSAIRGVRLYTTAFEYGRQLPVVSFNLEGFHSEEISEKLDQNGICVRAGLHCAPLAHEKMGTIKTGTVRASIGAFNTVAQAAELCDVVKKIAAKHCNTPVIW